MAHDRSPLAAGVLGLLSGGLDGFLASKQRQQVNIDKQNELMQKFGLEQKLSQERFDFGVERDRLALEAKTEAAKPTFEQKMNERRLFEANLKSLEAGTGAKRALEAQRLAPEETKPFNLGKHLTDQGKLLTSFTKEGSPDKFALDSFNIKTDYPLGTDLTARTIALMQDDPETGRKGFSRTKALLNVATEDTINNLLSDTSETSPLLAQTRVLIRTRDEQARNIQKQQGIEQEGAPLIINDFPITAEFANNVIREILNRGPFFDENRGILTFDIIIEEMILKGVTFEDIKLVLQRIFPQDNTPLRLQGESNIEGAIRAFGSIVTTPQIVPTTPFDRR